MAGQGTFNRGDNARFGCITVRHKQNGRKSSVVTRRLAAVAKRTICSNLRVVLARSLSATIVFEEEAEASVATPIPAVSVRLAAPVFACGGGTPLLQLLVDTARSCVAGCNGEVYEELIRTDCVGQVSQGALAMSRRAAK